MEKVYFDYKFYFIYLLQSLVKLSNFLQRKIIKSNEINLSGEENLLILKLDRIGDSVWTVYFVRILKEKYPDIKITVICNVYNRFVFEENRNLFEKIISINDNPPGYIIKNFFKLFYIFDWIQTFLINKKLWKNLRYKGFDYILNFTGRKYFFVSKYLGKSVGNGLGMLNFIYDYPLIGHNEIGSNIHVVNKWLNVFGVKNISKSKILESNILNNYLNGKLSIEDGRLNKVLFFVGGKGPNKLSENINEKIICILKKHGFVTNILTDDDKQKKYNFVLTKNDNGLYVKDKSLKEFVHDFDLFVGIDGGILHYISQFIPTLSFYTSTNISAAYPFGGEIESVESIGQWKIYISQVGKHCIVSKKLDCQGCFQVGCLLKKCGNFIDNEIEIIINRSIYALLCSN